MIMLISLIQENLFRNFHLEVDKVLTAWFQLQTSLLVIKAALIKKFKTFTISTICTITQVLRINHFVIFGIFPLELEIQQEDR